MDDYAANDLIDHAVKVTNSVLSKYAMWHLIDETSKEDLVQGALLSYLDASSRGLNTKCALWRGVLEQIRFIVFKGILVRKYTVDKRLKQAKFVPIDDFEGVMAQKGRSVEDLAEAERRLERMKCGTPKYDYFIMGKTLSDIGKGMGLTEGRACQMVHERL